MRLFLGSAMFFFGTLMLAGLLALGEPQRPAAVAANFASVPGGAIADGPMLRQPAAPQRPR